MKKNRFISYYNNELASFRMAFKGTLKTQEMEEIHKLRVSIKKLRTILSLIEALSHGKWLKKEHFELFSPLFKVAGKVRDTQVNLNLIEKYDVKYLLSFVEHLRKTQNIDNKKLLKVMQEFDFKRLEELNNQLQQKMKELSNEVTFHEFATFALKEDQKIYKLKNQLPDVRKLHKIRIHLKTLYEILVIMKELNAATGLDKLQSNIKSLNNKIGQWHDYIILLESLNVHKGKNTEKKNIQHLENLVMKIENLQKTRQKKIQKLLNKHITQQQLKQIENLP